jgi:hypothetical protein
MAPGGLRQDPDRAVESLESADFLADFRTFRNGRYDMRVLWTRYGSRRKVEPMMGLAVQLGALAPAVERCDAPVATGVAPTGGWR